MRENLSMFVVRGEDWDCSCSWVCSDGVLVVVEVNCDGLSHESDFGSDHTGGEYVYWSNMRSNARLLLQRYALTTSTLSPLPFVPLHA